MIDSELSAKKNMAFPEAFALSLLQSTQYQHPHIFFLAEPTDKLQFLIIFQKCLFSMVQKYFVFHSECSTSG